MVISSILFTVLLAVPTSILSIAFSTVGVASCGGGDGVSVGSVEVVEDEDIEGGGYVSTSWSVVEGAYPLAGTAAGIAVVGKFRFRVLPPVSEKKIHRLIKQFYAKSPNLFQPSSTEGYYLCLTPFNSFNSYPRRSPRKECMYSTGHSRAIQNINVLFFGLHHPNECIT